MKKNIKNNLVILTLIFIVILNIIYPSKVFAASASISAGSNSIYEGESTTISINVAGTETFKFSLSATGGSLSSTSVADAFGEEKTTTAMTSTFSSSVAGTYTISFTGSVAGSDLVPKNVSGSTTITVKKKENTGNTNSGGNNNNSNNNNNNNSNNNGGNTQKPTIPQESGSNNNNNNNNNKEKPKSSNNYLKELSLGIGKLSPEFYRETYEYTVEFDDTVNLYELNEIEIKAEKEDERASINGAGTISLSEGENTITVTVAAENGSERSYTIKLVKPQKIEQSALRLNALVINGIDNEGVYQTINLELDPEKFEYDLTVPNEITALSIVPTTENEDIIIEKIGDDTLKEGDNKIEIVLTSPSDKEIKTTYVLNVQREISIPQIEGITKEQTIMIIGAGVVGLILLIVIIVLIVKHAKKKKANDFEFVNNLGTDDIYGNSETNDTMDKTDDIDVPKLKWLDANDMIPENEMNPEENEDIEEKKDKKQGKRFV